MNVITVYLCNKFKQFENGIDQKSEKIVKRALSNALQINEKKYQV